MCFSYHQYFVHPCVTGDGGWGRLVVTLGTARSDSSAPNGPGQAHIND